MMLVMMVAALSFTACGSDSDDEGDSNPLVGTWYTESLDHGEIEYTEVTYKSDMTCTWKEFKADRVTIKDSDYGRYKVDGNLLIIWWNDSDGSAWKVTFSINGNKMTTSEGGGTIWTKKR